MCMCVRAYVCVCLRMCASVYECMCVRVCVVCVYAYAVVGAFKRAC